MPRSPRRSRRNRDNVDFARPSTENGANEPFGDSDDASEFTDGDTIMDSEVESSDATGDEDGSGEDDRDTDMDDSDAVASERERVGTESPVYKPVWTAVNKLPKVAVEVRSLKRPRASPSSTARNCKRLARTPTRSSPSIPTASGKKTPISAASEHKIHRKISALPAHSRARTAPPISAISRSKTPSISLTSERNTQIPPFTSPRKTPSLSTTSRRNTPSIQKDPEILPVALSKNSVIDLESESDSGASLKTEIVDQPIAIERAPHVPAVERSPVPSTPSVAPAPRRFDPVLHIQESNATIEMGMRAFCATLLGIPLQPVVETPPRANQVVKRAPKAKSPGRVSVKTEDGPTKPQSTTPVIPPGIDIWDSTTWTTQTAPQLQIYREQLEAREGVDFTTKEAFEAAKEARTLQKSDQKTQAVTSNATDADVKTEQDDIVGLEPVCAVGAVKTHQDSEAEEMHSAMEAHRRLIKVEKENRALIKRTKELEAQAKAERARPFDLHTREPTAKPESKHKKFNVESMILELEQTRENRKLDHKYAGARDNEKWRSYQQGLDKAVKQGNWAKAKDIEKMRLEECRRELREVKEKDLQKVVEWDKAEASLRKKISRDGNIEIAEIKAMLRDRSEQLEPSKQNRPVVLDRKEKIKGFSKGEEAQTAGFPFMQQQTDEGVVTQGGQLLSLVLKHALGPATSKVGVQSSLWATIATQEQPLLQESDIARVLRIEHQELSNSRPTFRRPEARAPTEYKNPVCD
ncbi:MAG: hypothetical protein M1812_005775 [Candelaria pacifica]|nr:MAG: hypothetical protein M1812_005775 [Candelaria pacifica]